MRLVISPPPITQKKKFQHLLQFWDIFISWFYSNTRGDMSTSRKIVNTTNKQTKKFFNKIKTFLVNSTLWPWICKKKGFSKKKKQSACHALSPPLLLEWHPFWWIDGGGKNGQQNSPSLWKNKWQPNKRRKKDSSLSRQRKIVCCCAFMENTRESKEKENEKYFSGMYQMR